MLIALLLITHATCEWVEISQQHYRKPVRINFHKTTEATEVYANATISPHIWIDHRKPNVGNKRGEASSNEDFLKAEIGNHAFKHEAITQRYEVNKDIVGTVVRVTNVGKVKRVQLANSPVKSPSVVKNVSSGNLKNVFTNDDFSKESEEYRISSNDFRKQYISTTEENPFRTHVSRIPLKNYTLINNEEPNYFISGKVQNENEDYFNTHHENSAEASKMKINKIVHIESVKNPDNVIILDSTNTDDKSIKIINSGVPDIITSENSFNIKKHIKLNENNNQDRKVNPTVKSIQNDGDKLEEAKIIDTNAPTEETPTPDTKAKAMEVLLKIIRTVADTIAKNSHRSLNSKMKYLHQLKNTLLDNIENRIDSIWPDDKDLQDDESHRTRFARDTARGHVEFPSSESALMTISFLTFAVFLIKLVLQVIQTYKNKTMMVAPLVVATAGRAALQRLPSHIKHNN